AIARQRQSPDLQEAKLRCLSRRLSNRRLSRGRASLLGQTHGEFDLHGMAQRVLTGPNQDIENFSEREGAVLEHGSKTDDARARPAHTIVDRVVVPGVS